MSLLDAIWDLFRAPAPVPIPSKTTIQGTRVIEILKPYTDNIWSSDSYYNTVDKKIIQNFLLKNPVNNRKYITEYHDCPLPENYAYALGLFFADGTCGFRKNGSGAFWAIHGKQKDLEKAKKGLEERLFVDVSFDIKLYDSNKKGVITNYGIKKQDTYTLIVHANKRGERLKFIKEFYKLFYRNGEKKTPSPLMECNMTSKKAFLDGALDGDGISNLEGKKIRLITNKLGVYGLIKLMKDISWNPTLSKENRTKKPMYYIGINRRNEPHSFILETIKNINTEWVNIKNILSNVKYNHDNTLNYIRKLEKEKYLISRRNDNDNRIKEVKLIKNFIFCDDFSYELMGDVSDWSSDLLFGMVWGNNANGDAHAWNFFIDDKEKLWFVEPQTDQIFEPTKEKIWIFIF